MALSTTVRGGTDGDYLATHRQVARMSAEAVGWVYRHSPAKGATLLVHLAAADSANDAHGYELWMRQAWLADKTRLSRRAVTEALAWLTEAGLLQLLDAGASSGRPNRYRLLMPSDLPPVWEPQGTQDVRTPLAPRADRGAQPVLTGVRSTCAHNPTGIPSSEPKANGARVDAVLGAAFEEFWTAYPRKTAKAEARKAWPAAVRAAGSVTVVLDGARRYAADPNREPTYTAHASTWLRAERWNDEALPSRTAPARNARNVDTDRGGQSGPIRL